MAGQKRRKPDGVLGFIADAIDDQAKARAQTQQLEENARLAWARENTKTATAISRDRARQELRQAKEREVAEGHAQAEAVTRTLQGQLKELQTLLAGTLEEDPYLPWDRFKTPVLIAEFKPPKRLTAAPPPPDRADFMPEPPTGLGALAPGRRRAHAQALADGQAAYEKALAEHSRAEQIRKEQLARARTAHEQSADRERETVRQQHALIDQMARDFADGKRKAVADYFTGILAVQRYPSDFPTSVKVAYLPPDRELRIDIALPLLTAIPELESAEYQVTKKQLKYKKLTAAARKELYQQVVAQMALRTLRCVYAADREGIILEAVCNGYVDTVDTSTGQDAHWCLVSVQLSRADFARLDLARIDPVDCLTGQHAKVSKTPEKYQPVQPIVDYPWDDLHYADEIDAAAGLDSVQNLLDLDGYEFEQLLVKLCQEIPEFDEVRRTRSRADGGIDLVAVNKTPFVGGRVAIQAKRYAPHHKVDIAAVREIIGSISQREFTKGIIITTSGFTSAARQEAERLGVELYDGEHLLWLLRHHLHREFAITDHSRRQAPFKKPPGKSAAP
ncbi:MAG TPA: restriction endonuclease [Streptosporangiaceae bacterium]|nr:restriction endonuclease [Streptosporangiaceae bacterium]